MSSRSANSVGLTRQRDRHAWRATFRSPPPAGLRRGGAKIPEIRKHPPETGPQNRPENRVNTPPEGSRDSFRQRKPLTCGSLAFFAGEGASAVEVNRPNRQLRQQNGKSDPLDAESAALP